jgi:hypothetical protein
MAQQPVVEQQSPQANHTFKRKVCPHGHKTNERKWLLEMSLVYLSGLLAYGRPTTK